MAVIIVYCKGTQSHSYREAIERISQYRRGKKERTKEIQGLMGIGQGLHMYSEARPRLIMWPWQGSGS